MKSHSARDLLQTPPYPSPSAEPEMFGNKLNDKIRTGGKIFIFGTTSIKSFVKSGDICSFSLRDCASDLVLKAVLGKMCAAVT